MSKIRSKHAVLFRIRASIGVFPLFFLNQQAGIRWGTDVYFRKYDANVDCGGGVGI